MRIVCETKICDICGKHPAIIYCDGCARPLCQSCRKFDMWQQDCGSINTKVFCPSCAADAWINPWGSAVD